MTDPSLLRRIDNLTEAVLGLRTSVETTLAKLDRIPIPRYAHKATRSQTVLTLLRKRGQLHIKDVATVLSIPYRSASNSLLYLADRGLVELVGRGYYKART